LEIKDEEMLYKLEPNFSELKKIKTRVIIVTVKNSTRKNVDFLSRCFVPAFGIDEDPVTGSAHCFLAPYWKSKLNKDELIGYQASKRGGTVVCKLLSDNRVELGGNCVTVFSTKIPFSKQRNPENK